MMILNIYSTISVIYIWIPNDLFQAFGAGRLVPELPVVREDAFEGLHPEGLEGGGQEEQGGLHARTQHPGLYRLVQVSSGRAIEAQS